MNIKELTDDELRREAISDLASIQRQVRYVKASRLIKKQAAEIEKLKEIIERLEANNETNQ